ncbi:hypothetical protein [Desulfovibrio ferrophilus]|uniref:DsrE family protein n=1 Tax=Desulfovibrio ferrophilus TaxID=241368 RepID=A0A2Z6AZ60_9BACT|nr:hypothetical protein [Desulfovibrio ferrophilus]BBD08480.1 uncharacterized protein DFE_1754 [Desulfovibrio ferrophilus]
MDKKLGVYVSSNEHLPQLVKLCQAARRADVGVDIFFSHLGCSMMKDPLFEELPKVVNRMAMCLVCFEEHGGERPVPGFGDKDYATQERHCEIIDGCGRYLSF